MCDFSISANGSMQSGMRPCIIVDNNMAGAYSPCIHCVPLTSKDKRQFIMHYELTSDEQSGLDEPSIALCEQYTLVDKSQLHKKIGQVTKFDLLNIIELCKKNFPFTY